MFANLILGIIANLISWLLAPKPKPPDPGQFQDVPHATEGVDAGELAGTGWITAQVTWHGDTANPKPIRQGGKK